MLILPSNIAEFGADFVAPIITALPIGNGRLGAQVMGGSPTETLILNEVCPPPNCSNVRRGADRSFG